MDKPVRGFTRMIRDDRLKAERIDAAAALAGSDGERRFLRALLANVSGRDLEGRDHKALAAMAAEHWALGRVRQPGVPRVAVRALAGKPARTLIEIVNDDMPFLVDSVTAELVRQGLTLHMILHPILRVVRDAGGTLTELVDPGAESAAALAESWMRLETDPVAPARHAEIARQMEAVLADVRAAVADWPAMTETARQVVADLSAKPPRLPEAEIEDTTAFLSWLCEDNFTFLGYRRYVLDATAPKTRMTVAEGSGLGLLRDPDRLVFEGLRRQADLPEDVRAFLTAPKLMMVSKSNLRSTVHRPAQLDAVSVKIFDAKGAVAGEHLFVGLFTSMVYIRSPRNIPLLREKIERVTARAALRAGSHDAKSLQHILLTYPRDELFQIDEEDLFRIAMGVLQLQERQRTALFLRHDPFQRFVSALVYVPRERMSTALRHALQGLLEKAFAGPVTAYSTQFSDDSVLARLLFVVKTQPGQVPAADEAALEAAMVEAARGWEDKLREALIAAYPDGSGLALFPRYQSAFPVGYTAEYSAERAVRDCAKIEAALTGGRLQLEFYRAGDALRLRLVNKAASLPLSDVLPVLEAMGLRVLAESNYAVTVGETTAWIHDFALALRRAGGADPLAAEVRFCEAFERVWTGAMESDGFNALVLAAGLDWREVTVLRAYAKYLRQAGVPFGQAYLEETLGRNPGVARKLADLFLARAGAGPGKEEEIAAAIEADLQRVANLDEDRVLRRFLNVIRATLRTNFRQRSADGGHRPALCFKLDSRKVDELPLPRPMFEIWVYSPRVEGIHLRFGKVARGGLRWSDRREDFRTEILGLVKAQMVKNAVIVPVGAKGGFVVKHPPAARDALLAEGVECYKIFVRALLDVTDNIVGGAIRPPADVTCHDPDDPYLVVAADKGTATFSDIANGISAEVGHWLGDAFASGGSAGYDHKKMGITAKGVWEAVKRHFREMGRDTQTQDFLVAGVGDMSGDVFGNGMLLSPHIRLVAAFDHRHIFLDPGAEAAKSFAERKRLFDLPRSSWDDYDKALISKGGGVFARSLKAIPLSAEAQALLGLNKAEATPQEVMKAILKAPVDLLYFGGIGTYVKAAEERHVEVGDRANDAIRVDGRDVRASVIAEGANLGMTQRGRVEFARLGAGGKGGRLNTDAIDNSAGVDCSDHEVNIKILLAAVAAAGKIDLAARNALLAAMTDEVASLVLRDNYLQTQALSVTQSLAPSLLDRHGRFMRMLERQGKLDRAVEFLPDDETLADRAKSGEGLTRPEMAVLLAYAKIVLFEDLLASDLPDEKALVDDLLSYFPVPLRERYAEAAAAHPLRREIVGTVVGNEMINRAGITFVMEMAEETGLGAADIARGYLMARDAFGLPALWAGVEALDGKAKAADQIAALLALGRFLKRAAQWMIRYAERPIALDAEIARYGGPIETLRAGLPGHLGPAARAEYESRLEGYRKTGFPDALAARLAGLPILLSLAEIVRLGRAVGHKPEAVAPVYFAAGQRFGLDALRDGASALRARIVAHWDKMALAATIDDLYSHQYAIAAAALNGAGGTLDAWAARRGAIVGQTERMLGELRNAGPLDLAMLAVANRQLRALTGA